jgi:hypothetical protein
VSVAANEKRVLLAITPESFSFSITEEKGSPGSTLISTDRCEAPRGMNRNAAKSPHKRRKERKTPNRARRKNFTALAV